MIAAARNALQSALGERIQFDADLSRHTSLRIGGPADSLAMPERREDLVALLKLCAEYSLPHTVLGAGFNTLVLDGGIEGVVIRTSAIRRLSREPEGIQAETGVSHNSLMKYCIENGLAGLEFGAGIPGTVGGWVAMNAGIGEREAKDVVREVSWVEPGGNLRRAARDELRFRYRSLEGLAPGSIILSVGLAVTSSEAGLVKAEVDRMLARRRDTQPLDVPSCGSVFKNPEGDFAGRLIEAAGLKGAREGSAEVSEKHANFIANRGKATAADVLALIARIQETVLRETGIQLEPEVKIVGRPS